MASNRRRRDTHFEPDGANFLRPGFPSWPIGFNAHADSAGALFCRSVCPERFMSPELGSGCRETPSRHNAPPTAPELLSAPGAVTFGRAYYTGPKPALVSPGFAGMWGRQEINLRAGWNPFGVWDGSFGSFRLRFPVQPILVVRHVV